MPEYLAPGVFIEEVSYRSKSIEGVSTTTTGFIGPTRYGPINLEPDVITSLGEFERVYGDRQQLNFGNADDDTKQKMDNFMWHAVRAFFEEGGKRLYIVRTFRPIDEEDDDGYAKAFVPGTASPEDGGSWLKFSARFPGELGKMRVRLTLQLGQSVLGKDEINAPTVGGLLDKDVVYITVAPLVVSSLVSPPTTSPSDNESGFYLAQKKRDPVTGEISWEFQPVTPSGSPSDDILLTDLSVDNGDRIQVVTLTVATLPVENPDAQSSVWSGLALDPEHKRAGQP
nr:hypothetical protein [Pyrinomonadaceae bacterium]